MKKAILAGLIGMVLVLPSLSAVAGHRGHDYRKSYHHGGRHHYGGYYRSDDALVAVGIIGGAVLLGAILSRPAHTHVHTQYAPPPPYGYFGRGRRCYHDQVWRYLPPDGRVQTGTRTTCY